MLLSLLCAASVGAAPARAAGLVANPTFETGTWGWFSRPTAGGLTRASGGHSGSYAARLANTTTAAATTVLNDSVNTVHTTAAGTTYRASAWVRAVQAGVTLVIRTTEYAGTTRVTQKQTSRWTTDTAWHQLSVDLPAARSGSTIDLNVLAWTLGAGRSFLVDDVAVTTVASVAPLSIASGGPLPAQGTGALFGYYQAGGADPRPMESKIGRKFGLIHHYADFNGRVNRWPTAAMVGEESGGRTIHVGWEMQTYDGTYDSSLQPAPWGKNVDLHGNVRKLWTYQQVNNGSLDRYLDVIALRVKASPYKYVVDIEHEMDDRPDVGGRGTLRAAGGTRAEYVAAYRHVVNRFRARGVANVTWAWTVSGWYASDPTKAWSLRQLWPGSSYVNVILWDPYNKNRANWKTFAQIVTPFYQAIRGGLLDPVDANAKRLPLGLAEYGCVEDWRRPAWLRAIPSQVKGFPGIVTLGYYSSGTWGALHTDPAAITAFGQAGADWYLKPAR